MPDKAMFGRFWPGTSPVHRMDPRAKLLLSLALMVATFCARTTGGLAVCAAFVVGFYAVAGIPLGQALRSIGPLLFIVVVTALLNVFFVQGGTVYFHGGSSASARRGSPLRRSSRAACCCCFWA